MLVLAALMLGAGCKCARSLQEPMSAAERQQTGATLAFISERSGHVETFVIGVDGTAERRLTDGVVFPAAASPDGRELLAIATSGDGEAHLETLYAYPLDGGAPRQLSAPASRLRAPSWSPDGDWVAYASSARGFSDIFVVGAQGADPVQLTHDEHGAFEPSFSPDGERLAFVSTADADPEVYVMRRDGGDRQRLTAFHLEDTAPCWSPSGALISFITNRRGRDELFVMAPDGSGQRKVAADEGEAAEQSASSPPLWSDREAAWSPDGTKLAFTRQRSGGRSRIWIADVTSGGAAAITDGKSDDSMPSWSPDGRYLAFVSDRTGDPELFLMRADGSGQTRITAARGADWRPLWIPAPRGKLAR